jgi:hypothetical protein
MPLYEPHGFELKHVQHNAELSEETYAGSAHLWVDGVFVGTVANHGTGGPWLIRGPSHQWQREMVEWLKETQPPEIANAYEPLDVLISELFHEAIKEKQTSEIERKMLKKVRNNLCFIDEYGNIKKFAVRRGYTREQMKQRIEERQGPKQWLDELPFDQQIEKMRALYERNGWL